MNAKETSIELAQAAIKNFIPIKEKTLREKLVELALTQVGITENPPGTNCVLYNTWFYGREVRDGDKPGAKYPWCCTFICWLFNEIGKPMPRADYLRGWSSVPSLYKYAKKNNMLTKTPKPGDLIIYFWNGEIRHIGIYTGENNNKIENVEGNTAFDDAGDQSNGGCCAFKLRNQSLILDYINIDKFLE